MNEYVFVIETQDEGTLTVSAHGETQAEAFAKIEAQYGTLAPDKWYLEKRSIRGEKAFAYPNRK